MSRYAVLTAPVASWSMYSHETAMGRDRNFVEISDQRLVALKFQHGRETAMTCASIARDYGLDSKGDVG